MSSICHEFQQGAAWARLNRGGHWRANAALHRVVVVRMHTHEPTIDYVRRRTAEGKSKREIIR
jgi:transposase